MAESVIMNVIPYTPEQAAAIAAMELVLRNDPNVDSNVRAPMIVSVVDPNIPPTHTLSNSYSNYGNPRLNAVQQFLLGNIRNEEDLPTFGDLRDYLLVTMKLWTLSHGVVDWNFIQGVINSL